MSKTDKLFKLLAKKHRLEVKLAKVKAKDVKLPIPGAFGIPFGVNKSATIMLDDAKPTQFCTSNHPEDGVGDGPLRKHIHNKTPPVPGMVEHMDALVTFWDRQLDDMSGGFHLLRDRLVNAEDHATLKLVDELLHRVVEVRCQLDTMKKEQDQ